MAVAVEICKKNCDFFFLPVKLGFFDFYYFFSAMDFIVQTAGCFWKGRLNFAGD